MPQSQAHAYFEMHYSPLFNETQMIIGGLAIMRDITQRKLAEEAQQRQHDYLLALQEMALSLNTHLELAELLSNITTRASALLATEHVFLILIEPDGVALVNEFSLGIFASGAGKRISFMEGLVEKVRQTKQGIVLNSDVDMLEITYMSIQQCAGIPLINGTEVVGLLGAVCLSGAPPFREGEIALLKQLAQLASIAINQDALNAANARLAAMALTDPLTGLSNHGCVMDQLDKALQECKHSGDQCAMLFIDIDHFKNINDTWGHRTGDAVLREVSKRLTSGIRQTDIVGRYGGEEFVILLLHLDEKEACEIAEQFRATLAAEPCKWFGEDGILMEIPITASIGVAAYPRHGTTREALIEAADSAMYYAKHHGRNCVSLVEMREASPLPTSELPEPKVAA